MEATTSTEKKTSKVKESKKENDTTLVESMKLAALPVKEAVFHRSVPSWTGTPETAFYMTGGKPSRTANMWLTPYVLICEQAKGVRTIIPLANVVYTKLL